MTAKTPTQRVEALRAERAALGIKRREVYAHDEDWPAIQELAALLFEKRAGRYNSPATFGMAIEYHGPHTVTVEKGITMKKSKGKGGKGGGKRC